MLLSLQNTSFAQDAGTEYNTAIGLRVGDIDFRGVGITGKHFFSPNNAGEAILTFYDTAFFISALYEFHKEIPNAEGLKWLAGIGPFLGIPDGGGDAGFGVSPIVGLDYKINDVPLNFGLDWRPHFLFTPSTEFEASSLGLSIRYAF
ncbi:hypothetical protein EDD80_105154 [Anseongella ginsenosidimutans]|uniref:Outer membrane protein n=2 Tax=Anseongella ginsenosidimutans TaxID=496056 RepID=A0A4R3KR06_9SPHI|nr:hypothetical protein EDD80_105154 [Anseongella ginsenosidimutans]